LERSGRKGKEKKNPRQPLNGAESSSSRGNISKVKCFNCNRKGHIARDYPKKKFEGEKGHVQHHGKDQSQSHQGNYADGVDEFLTLFENFSLLFTPSANDSRKDVWYIDSDASMHMTLHKKLFTTLKDIKGESIFLGDDRAHEVKGIDTILI
jgi:hypothetical protein